jgi:hypothetical protein
MRNLQLNESGTISLQKDKQFLHRYRLFTEGALLPGGKPKRSIETEIVRQSVLLLQGIPSEGAFELD